MSDQRAFDMELCEEVESLENAVRDAILSN